MLVELKVLATIRKKLYNEYQVYIPSGFCGNITTEDIVFNVKDFSFRESMLSDLKTIKFRLKKKDYIMKDGSKKVYDTGFDFRFTSLEEIETGKYKIIKNGDNFYLEK